MEKEPLTASPTITPEDQRRLSDVAVLADGLVHDIRNPLNVIRSNLYLLRQRLAEADAKTSRSLDRIDDQVTVALRLLEGLQALYRSDQPQTQRVNLPDVVRKVVDSHPVAEPIAFQVEMPAALPLVTADPELVEAVLRALIRNAQDGLIETPDRPGTIKLQVVAGEGEVTLMVEDNGPGIPPEVLSQVFTPFFTTRRARAGLGLAIAAKVADALHGRLLVESEPGKGTRVTLGLPTGRSA